ncbi:hypothetical protein NKH77_26055 [Streptomyces sp. M19]
MPALPAARSPEQRPDGWAEGPQGSTRRAGRRVRRSPSPAVDADGGGEAQGPGAAPAGAAAHGARSRTRRTAPAQNRPRTRPIRVTAARRSRCLPPRPTGRPGAAPQPNALPPELVPRGCCPPSRGTAGARRPRPAASPAAPPGRPADAHGTHPAPGEPGAQPGGVANPRRPTDAAPAQRPVRVR